MKNFKVLIPAMMTFIFLMSYQAQAQSRKVNAILENPEDRAYLMQKISNDKTLTTEMIDYLSNNVEAVTQLKSKFGGKKEMKMKHKIKEKDEEGKHKMQMCAMCKKNMEEKKKKNENEE